MLAAYAWRVIGLDRQSLWRDEVDAIYFAVRDLSETLRMFVQAAQNGPLYFLALRPWFAMMGTSEFVLRYPSVLAGVASVPLLWQVARRMLPDRRAGGLSIAMAAAIFMAFNPYQVWYGQEGKMYATITCLALLATWFWLTGHRGRRLAAMAWLLCDSQRRHVCASADGADHSCALCLVSAGLAARPDSTGAVTAWPWWA